MNTSSDTSTRVRATPVQLAFRMVRDNGPAGALRVLTALGTDKRLLPAQRAVYLAAARLVAGVS